MNLWCLVSSCRLGEVVWHNNETFIHIDMKMYFFNILKFLKPIVYPQLQQLLDECLGSDSIPVCGCVLASPSPTENMFPRAWEPPHPVKHPSQGRAMQEKIQTIPFTCMYVYVLNVVPHLCPHSCLCFLLRCSTCKQCAAQSLDSFWQCPR